MAAVGIAATELSTTIPWLFQASGDSRCYWLLRCWGSAGNNILPEFLVHFFVSDSLLVSASLFVRLCSEAARPEWRIGSHSSCFPRASILCWTGIAEQRTSFPREDCWGSTKAVWCLLLFFFFLIRNSCQILSSRVGGGRERGKEMHEVWKSKNPAWKSKSSAFSTEPLLLNL